MKAIGIFFIISFYSINALQLDNNNLQIVTYIKPPYMYYDTTLNQTGNARFSGFLKDMLDYLFAYLSTNTTYTLYISPSNSYGVIVNGSWDGLIKELLVGNADLIVADLTVTEQRRSAIDFTGPYLDLGLSLLVPKPVNDVNVWIFLSPFSSELWFGLLGLTFAMSIIVYVYDRLSPYGYYNTRREEKFNFSESLLMSLLVFVGKDSTPSRSWGARTILLFYFAFNLIIVSFYTANLTAALTVQMATVQVHGLNDLKAPGSYFSLTSGTASQTYFQNPSMALFKNHIIYYDTFNESISAMLDGEVEAVVEDSPSLDFVSNHQPCNTYVVGDIFFKSNFAIGLNYGNYNVSVMLSKGILHLRESGLIDDLYQGWWQVGSCGTSGDVSLNSNQLGLLDLAGAFVMVAIGVCAAFIVLAFELIFNKCYKGSAGILHHVDKFLGHSGDLYDDRM